MLKFVNVIVLKIIPYRLYSVFFCTVLHVHRIYSLFWKLNMENVNICTSLMYCTGLAFNKITSPILMLVRTRRCKHGTQILQPNLFFLGKKRLRLHLKRFCLLERTPMSWSIAIHQARGKRRKFAHAPSHSSFPSLPHFRVYGSRLSYTRFKYI